MVIFFLWCHRAARLHVNVPSTWRLADSDRMRPELGCNTVCYIVTSADFTAELDPQFARRTAGVMEQLRTGPVLGETQDRHVIPKRSHGKGEWLCLLRKLQNHCGTINVLSQPQEADHTAAGLTPDRSIDVNWNVMSLLVH